jgi:hypothetical protein
VESILRLALVEMEQLGIRRILTHSEAAAGYIPGGYASLYEEAQTAIFRQSRGITQADWRGRRFLIHLRIHAKPGISQTA